MTPASQQTELSADPSVARRQVVRLAWPLIVASASTPLLGLVDAAVLGHVGTAADLGAVALGSLIFNFIYWSFGFLRMGTTGFVAQAVGRGAPGEAFAALGRALGLGAVIAGLLLLLQRPLANVALQLLGATPDVAGLTQGYFHARIWGAPAALLNLGLLGTLIGLGETRSVLVIQLVLNGVNIALDVALAVGLSWGVVGVALGTAAAQWCGLLLAGVLVAKRLSVDSRRGTKPDWRKLLALEPWWRTLRASRDILLRTLFLLAGFGWFTHQGAALGSNVLAANHVLLQFISFAAFFLDGYAHVAESFVGRASGAGDVLRFDRAVRRTSELAVVTGALLGALFFATRTLAIRALTDIDSVVGPALGVSALAALYIGVSSLAFQLDGIFIGTTSGRALRNASLAAFGGFWLLSAPLTARLGNQGLWLSFVAFVLLRAGFLALALPALRRRVAGAAGA